ncbi:MAG: type III-B CRISPR module RAMP protein Cmr1 [Firmicutes bacterium]|nr:type III-B CRISPR module RAMP protein Cmr1 [Bacillota bacterium]
MRPGYTRKLFRISVVTPCFGGGPVPQKPDPLTPVRGTSVRGHLRFWWRATRGAEFRDVATLRKRESEIWGSTGSRSPVVTRVVCVPQSTFVGGGSQKDVPRQYQPQYRYVAWPFESVVRESAPGPFSFELQLEYPRDLDQDVLCAVWAWVNFGGVGARTRRGCGTLWCAELCPSAEVGNLHVWYETKLQEYGLRSIQDRKRRDWPTLPPPSGIVVRRDQQSPAEAWLEAVRVLQWFRQPRTRPKSGNQLASTKWPEVRTIRLLRHSGGRVGADSGLGFPRAQFGLPIVFRLREGGNLGTLVSAKSSRRASPVIVKAWALTVPNQPQPRARALVLRLEVPGLDGVRLEKVVGVPGGRVFGRDFVQPSGFRYPAAEGGGAPATDALEAFLSFVKSMWAPTGGVRR